MICFSCFQARYIKRFKLADAKFEDYFAGPLPNFIKSEAKRLPKGKGKKNKKKDSDVIDLTGEDEFIKQKKKERKEMMKKKEKGNPFVCLLHPT